MDSFATWMSIAIAALGAISAAVICWQVYVLIDMRSVRKQLDSANAELRLELLLYMAEVSRDFSSVFGMQGNTYFMICHTLQRIKYLSRAREFAKCEEEIESLILMSGVTDDIDKSKRDALDYLIDQIENRRKIRNFNKLSPLIDKYFPKPTK